MAVRITATDVKDFCAEADALSDSAIGVYIDMVSQADACLDLNNVADAVQKFLKLNAVCHYIAKSSGGQVKSERDMDGASVTFETYMTEGYGLASTTFGQNLLSTGSVCFDFMNTRPSRFMQAIGQMSTIRGRFLKDTVTRWREGVYDPDNPYSSGWADPVTIKCNYRSGGSIQRDQDGADFMPESTYRCKSADVQVGDRVILGISTATKPTASAETVKQVVTKTPLRGSADMTFFTG